jgi:hypothetical protein
VFFLDRVRISPLVVPDLHDIELNAFRFHVHPISLYPTSVGTVVSTYARRSGQK